MPEDTVLKFDEHNTDALLHAIDEAVNGTPVFDIHTHLSPAEFGDLCLWGIDELVRYHYLIAELFRSNPIKPERVLGDDEGAASRHHLGHACSFGTRPISEACRGVVCVMGALGLDPGAENLKEAREYFRSVSVGRSHHECVRDRERLASRDDERSVPSDRVRKSGKDLAGRIHVFMRRCVWTR